MKVNKINIPCEITDRRPGDIAVNFVSVEKSKKERNREAKPTIEDIVRDAWNFEKSIK